MTTREITQEARMRTGMLIRRPAADVYEAFVNPDITTQFWFTKSSGRLDVGQPVQWTWEMYEITVPVKPLAVEPSKRLVIEWAGYSGPCVVEWTFASLPDSTTFVEITESGYSGNGDELLRQVADSTQGFSLVLAGLKALLEHGVRLNLVADRFPGGIASH